MAKKKATLPVAKSNPKPVPVKIVSDANAPTSNKSYADQERKWKAQDALRTIQEAERVKSDKQLMADVKKLAMQQVNDLKKFTK